MQVFDSCNQYVNLRVGKGDSSRYFVSLTGFFDSGEIYEYLILLTLKIPQTINIATIVFNRSTRNVIIQGFHTRLSLRAYIIALIAINKQLN